ncbi:UNVERIFIED_CONTAM: hypothetical protein Slati_1347000 [Sesamum latifolium]|uniref:Uncharacterized protein n=1 Tax=Sesamum latifolium TaxID=2727402 RepID=A0AAW2XKL7_9LAMI
MENSKRGFLPMRHEIKLSKKKSPKTDEELKRMSDIPYASAVGNIQYVVHHKRPDVVYDLSVTSRYQACAGEAHWSVVKTIFKYLKITKDMFFIYNAIKTLASSRTMTIPNSNRVLYSSLMVVCCLESSKQATTADYTMKAEYIAASEAAKEAFR